MPIAAFGDRVITIPSFDVFLACLKTVTPRSPANIVIDLHSAHRVVRTCDSGLTAHSDRAVLPFLSELSFYWIPFTTDDFLRTV